MYPKFIVKVLHLHALVCMYKYFKSRAWGTHEHLHACRLAETTLRTRRIHECPAGVLRMPGRGAANARQGCCKCPAGVLQMPGRGAANARQGCCERHVFNAMSMAMHRHAMGVARSGQRQHRTSVSDRCICTIMACRAIERPVPLACACLSFPVRIILCIYTVTVFLTARTSRVYSSWRYAALCAAVNRPTRLGLVTLVGPYLVGACHNGRGKPTLLQV
jgi:hypothetical protein